MKNNFFSHVVDNARNTNKMIALGYRPTGQSFNKNGTILQAFITDSIEASDAYDKWQKEMRLAEKAGWFSRLR